MLQSTNLGGSISGWFGGYMSARNHNRPKWKTHFEISTAWGEGRPQKPPHKNQHPSPLEAPAADGPHPARPHPVPPTRNVDESRRPPRTMRRGERRVVPSGGGDELEMFHGCAGCGNCVPWQPKHPIKELVIIAKHMTCIPFYLYRNLDQLERTWNLSYVPKWTKNSVSLRFLCCGSGRLKSRGRRLEGRW